MRPAEKTERNAAIVAAHGDGLSATELSAMYALSRTRVVEILENAGVWSGGGVSGRRLDGGELWTVRDVARYLGLQLRTVSRGFYRTIPRVRISARVVRFNPAEVKAWAETRGITHPAQGPSQENGTHGENA